jgi:ribosomal protein S26
MKRASGKVRLCIDPKPLNKALKRSHYLMPVVEDLLPELSQAKVFSKCDVKNAFWHVKLDEGSSHLSSF